jgi:Xaa-Pro aminopeptidase
MAVKQTKVAPTPSSAWRQRCRAVQQRMAAWKTDALLVTNARDIRYLTGFVGDDSWAVLPRAGGDVYLLSDFRFKEQIQREAPQVRAIMRKLSLSDELVKLADRLKLQRLAISADYITVRQRTELVRRLGARRLTEVDDGLLKQRAVKDASELKAIRKALKIQQRAFTQTLAFIEPGRTEAQIAAHLEYQMRLLGADGNSFPTIVAADANASLPHAIPGSRKVRRNGIVLIDWGARGNGYCSDLTRVVGVGGMSAKMREVYQVVLEAQLAAIDAIAPGKALKDVDGIARRIIDKAGYGPQFGHSLGHGIGLDIHEQPTLSPRSHGMLEPGHVVTVEPGIYLPGVGGVRIEDDVLVTARGGQVLSSLGKDLADAII